MPYAPLPGEGPSRGAGQWRRPPAALLLASATTGALLALCVLGAPLGAPVGVSGWAPAGAVAGAAAAASGRTPSGGGVLVLSSSFTGVHGETAALFYSVFGRALMVLMFLGAAANLGVSGFTLLATEYGFPMPAAFAICAELLVAAGSLLVLVAPLIPSAWCSVVGAEMLLIFMVVATYVSHFRPMLASEGEAKQDHIRHLMKDLTIIGALVLLAANVMSIR